MVLGSWFLALGSWFLVLGSWLLALGLLVLGSLCLVVGLLVCWFVGGAFGALGDDLGGDVPAGLHRAAGRGEFSVFSFQFSVFSFQWDC